MSANQPIGSALIVDDDEADAFLTRLMLERSGCYGIVDVVESADSALERFLHDDEWRRRAPGAHPPLLILLDINMPRMDGFEFLERFESWCRQSGHARTSVVVMLTSSDDDADRVRALQFDSVVDFVQKPLTVERARQIAGRLGSQ